MFLRICLLTIFLSVVAQGNSLLDFDFSVELNELSIDTLIQASTLYHKIAITDYENLSISHEAIGYPELPYTTSTFLLPPNVSVDSLFVSDTTWETIPGKFYLFPSQSTSLTYLSFTTPDSTAYNSSIFYPASPISIVKQGSAMGFSLVTLVGFPLRYSPEDSSLEYLTNISFRVDYKSMEVAQIMPLRETSWSAATRLRGISSLISNPEELSFYPFSEIVDYSERLEPLIITEFPSPDGDCVDMVIITSETLKGAFENFADYRTRQGIVTTVRTVEWITTFYSGSDTQERIRNFIVDAHTEWGIQAVILGGDDGVVPPRQCNGWNYAPGPYPHYMLPSDDYYSDIDGNWSTSGTIWQSEANEHYLDLCLGRWPVNTESDVNSLFMKIKIYEQPDEFPENFARQMLLLGSNNPAGNGANDMMALVEQLEQSSSIPEYLDPPSTLYFPHSLPGGNLNRINSLEKFNQGYNLIFHADHSEIHKLATAGNGTLGEFLWDSDFSGMFNTSQPSILWTLGCDTGHFDGAYCYAEAAMMTSSTTGMVAVIANARGGLHVQKLTAYSFIDALYNTGYLQEGSTSKPIHWPLTYLGEVYRCSKNTTNLSFEFLNLLGSPLMYVWRNNPLQLSVSTPLFFLAAGTMQDLPVTVTDGSNPVANATVCIWKENEVFAVEQTNESGDVLFSDIAMSDHTSNLFITATKRRILVNSVETVPVDFIPAQIEIDVLPPTIPVITLSEFYVDPDGNGSANPGETVEIHLLASNTGNETASDVSVEMFILAGDEYINSIINNQSSFPDIFPSASENSNTPLKLSLNQGIANNSLIEILLTFTYTAESQNYSWNSTMCLSIFSDEYLLTSLSPSICIEDNKTVSIDLTDMIFANIGFVSGSDIEVTIDNIYPSEPFVINSLSIPSIPANATIFVSDSLNLSITPLEGESEWLTGLFQNCFIDVTVSTESGDFLTRHISLAQVKEYQDLKLSSPSNLQIVESGEDYISLDWNHYGDVDAEKYYIYCDDGITNPRVFPLPVPVREVTINNLLPGRNYKVGITALDVIGRESIAALIKAETICPMVDGWPLFLEGSPGSGPISADIDNDGFDEIVIATSFGVVYIIERNGETRELYPPPNLTFSRVLGTAVGDVDNDGKLEIVVSCQLHFDEEGNERVAMLLFDSFSGLWSSEVIAETQVNEEVASPYIAGTPVLFQADNSPSLEIALRTRGNNGGTPHLYVWKFDSASNEWIIYSSVFPIPLQGWFSNSPTAVDFDNDNFEELLITNYGSGTDIIIADFEAGGTVSLSTFELPELNTEGYWARAFGTIAVAEQNSNFYLAGVAKPESQSSNLKKIFVYLLTADPEPNLSLQWQSDWLTGIENFGNMPGPAIGNINNDSDLEVLYTLNGGTYNTEGILQGWNLQNGDIVFLSDTIPFNPILGGGGAGIKSQPSIALTTQSNSDAMTVFTGFSSGLSGFDPVTDESSINGFPVYTRDGALATPLLCDLDNNTIPEVLYVDASGYAALFNYQDAIYTSEGWHMYQDNPRRTGFYNTTTGSDKIDIYLKQLFVTAPNLLTAEIEILNSGLSSFPTAQNSIQIIEEEETTTIPISLNERGSTRIPSIQSINSNLLNLTVKIALFNEQRLLFSELINVFDGPQTIELEIPSDFINAGNLTLVVDPFNDLDEQNERNNTLAVSNFLHLNNTHLQSITIPTPSDKLSIEIFLSEALPSGLSVLVYSLGGRIVEQVLTDELFAGTTNLFLAPQKQLPNGIYTVTISGTNFPQTTKKVIILQ